MPTPFQRIFGAIDPNVFGFGDATGGAQGGAIAAGFATVAAGPYTIGTPPAGTYVVTANSLAVNLPAAAKVGAGTLVVVKNQSGTTGTTLHPASGDKIENATGTNTTLLSASAASARLVSDGVGAWHAI